MEQQKKELVDWLHGLAPWEIFFTGTTRYAAGCASLQRSFVRFMGKEYRDVSYVYTLEPHSSSGFHVHSMFDQGHDIKWTEFWAKWFERFGRNRTEPIIHAADVESYVLKYVAKGWEDEKREEMVGDKWKERHHGKQVWWDVKLSAFRRRKHTRQLGRSRFSPKKEDLQLEAVGAATRPLSELGDTGALGKYLKVRSY